MPGRGRFWSLGSLNDGIVEEDDLTQALQTKVNSGGGGGAWQKVTEVELTVAGNQINMPISPSIVMDTVAEVKVIAKIRLGDPGQVRYVINDIITGGQYNSVGIEYTSGELDNDIIDEQDISTGFSSSIDFFTNNGNYTVWELCGGETLQGFSGHIREDLGKFTTTNYLASWNTPLTAITNLKINADQDMVIGSKASVWKLPF